MDQNGLIRAGGLPGESHVKERGSGGRFKKQNAGKKEEYGRGLHY